MTLRRRRLESTQSLLEQMLSTWVLQMLSCLQRKMASLLVDISENLQVFQVHYMCVVICSIFLLANSGEHSPVEHRISAIETY